MSAGMARTLILLFLIGLGFFLKKVGFFGPEDRNTLGKLYTTITFPAVIVGSYSSFERDLSLLWLVVIGLLADLAYLFVILLFFHKKSKEEQAFAGINGSALSIGAFTLPFLQGYLSPAQLIPVMLYDIGNGIMAFSGTLIAGEVLLRKEQRGFLRTAFRQLLRSVPVWTYLLMLGFHMAGKTLPASIYTAANFIGAANPVLTMLLIGCTLEFPKKLVSLLKVEKILAIHYGTAVILALLFYFLLPYTQSMRAVMVVLLFSPLGSAALVYTERLGLDQETAGFLNTITIFISIFAITVLISALGLCV